ncbi:hypothetical protein IMG5_148620 [Ichthyophthirius multifiliis]|uniref:Transmembrane protein n=1 Tax=Ichthyophthirius multifiliis TaxID=5932 RepID=G0QYB8_ICHMU|nr:hypothetical protein IMG5_148620 [Ichthyophthirius multifiliis]EGR29781.1 hypothetical protein IMG5_148620 [Ichthyophthirius multifiliis]|eukprot:XP_004031017.1 hypothetical protein IMG5_148620 [Ichthyophthirius multifiliis]
MFLHFLIQKEIRTLLQILISFGKKLVLQRKSKKKMHICFLNRLIGQIKIEFLLQISLLLLIMKQMLFKIIKLNIFRESIVENLIKQYLLLMIQWILLRKKILIQKLRVSFIRKVDKCILLISNINYKTSKQI